MPWKECHVMDERLRFVARLLDGERMTTLCEEFGISPEDGLQNLRPLQSLGRAGADGPQSPPAAARESAADNHRTSDRSAQETVPDVGRT